MLLKRFLPLFVLPFLVGCSDERATFEIQGSAHALSLIRVVSWPWDKTAKFSVVAARMPDCMRRHAMSEVDARAKVEVFSPGNNAWILRQAGRMFVVETRTCEGFAPLEGVPEGGLGRLMGTFEMTDGKLVFNRAAAPSEAPNPAPTN